MRIINESLLLVHAWSTGYFFSAATLRERLSLSRRQGAAKPLEWHSLVQKGKKSGRFVSWTQGCPAELWAYSEKNTVRRRARGDSVARKRTCKVWTWLPRAIIIIRQTADISSHWVKLHIMLFTYELMLISETFSLNERK